MKSLFTYSIIVSKLSTLLLLPFIASCATLPHAQNNLDRMRTEIHSSLSQGKVCTDDNSNMFYHDYTGKKVYACVDDDSSLVLTVIEPTSTRMWFENICVWDTNGELETSALQNKVRFEGSKMAHDVGGASYKLSSPYCYSVLRFVHRML